MNLLLQICSFTLLVNSVTAPRPDIVLCCERERYYQGREVRQNQISSRSFHTRLIQRWAALPDLPEDSLDVLTGNAGDREMDWRITETTNLLLIQNHCLVSDYLVVTYFIDSQQCHDIARWRKRTISGAFTCCWVQKSRCPHRHSLVHYLCSSMKHRLNVNQSSYWLDWLLKIEVQCVSIVIIG